MRAIAAVALLALLPLAGGFQLQEAQPESALAAASLATSAAPSPAPAASAPVAILSCVPTVDAERIQDHVTLFWTDCPGEESYQVWRGPSAAELTPLVVVNHASHVDFPGAPAVYAVRAGGGPLSEAVAIAWG